MSDEPTEQDPAEVVRAVHNRFVADEDEANAIVRGHTREDGKGYARTRRARAKSGRDREAASRIRAQTAIIRDQAATRRDQTASARDHAASARDELAAKLDADLARLDLEETERNPDDTVDALVGRADAALIETRHHA
jgi:hypothetical protein